MATLFDSFRKTLSISALPSFFFEVFFTDTKNYFQHSRSPQSFFNLIVAK
jgi:hypothetical protein